MNRRTKMLTRRRVLRGAVDGVAVSVSLPFLDCFLNTNGTALAATGTALPVCFGIWWQGLGLTPGRWMPDTIGPGYQNNVELKVLDPFRSRTNIISGTKYFLDGKPLETHLTGWQIASIGTIPNGAESGPSLDSSIADVVGAKTRFRSLEVSVGGTTESYSKRAGSGNNPSEPSPIALYARIFGADFKDPNAAAFKPDPMVLARGYLDAAGFDKTELDRIIPLLDQAEKNYVLEKQFKGPSDTPTWAPR